MVSHLLRSSQREIKTKLRAADVKAMQTASKRKQNFRVDISLLILTTDTIYHLLYIASCIGSVTEGKDTMVCGTISNS